jgi:CheY-like chemotaxis protein
VDSTATTAWRSVLLPGGIVLRKKNILIVDHSLEAAHRRAAVLRGRRYSVRIAPSGAEAVACLRDSRPDLVILNLSMPDDEAYRVTSVLSAGEDASIPVLGLIGPGAARAQYETTSLRMEFLPPTTSTERMVAAVERIVGPPLLPNGCRCALCDGVSRESALSFVHHRKGERASLDVPLCETCGNRLEKHLKRVIPKRLIEFTSFEYGTQLAEPIGN